MRATHNRVLMLRYVARVKRADAARAAGVSLSTFNNMEGGSSLPTHEAVQALAALYGTHPDIVELSFLEVRLKRLEAQLASVKARVDAVEARRK